MIATFEHTARSGSEHLAGRGFHTAAAAMAEAAHTLRQIRDGLPPAGPGGQPMLDGAPQDSGPGRG